MKLGEPLSQLLTKRLNAFPIDSATASVRSHTLPGHLQVLPLIHLVDQ